MFPVLHCVAKGGPHQVTSMLEFYTNMFLKQKTTSYAAMFVRQGVSILMNYQSWGQKSVRMHVAMLAYVHVHAN